MLCLLEKINDEMSSQRDSDWGSFNLKRLQLISRKLGGGGFTAAPERPKDPGAPWQRGYSVWCCIHPWCSSYPGWGCQAEHRQGHRRRWIWPCSAPERKDSNRDPMISLCWMLGFRVLKTTERSKSCAIKRKSFTLTLNLQLNFLFKTLIV